jgi:hypothetical protein
LHWCARACVPPAECRRGLGDCGRRTRSTRGSRTTWATTSFRRCPS